jgi:hypothetical protein
MSKLTIEMINRIETTFSVCKLNPKKTDCDA